VPAPLPATTGGGSFRARFGLGDRRIVSLFGYIAVNKGYELSFDVMDNLPADVVFVIAGGPRTDDQKLYEEQLRARIAAKGLSDRICITGYLADEVVAEAMAASEIVVTPHTQATGSYSVMIPLSYGKPVVSSDLDVFREIHQRGDCIELFPSENAGAYAAKLNALLADADRRACLSERALEYSRQHSWPQIARRTIAIYEEAIKDETRLSHHALS
jgi:glycosyltransferase involved in cell wall biosynthesis